MRPYIADTLTFSIISIVGLAGHGFGSWKARARPDMWLRDFLPAAAPDARIMTYGYDTELPGSQSEKSIIELSRNLLESVKTSRDETCVGFLHSGGIPSTTGLTMRRSTDL